MLLVVILAVSRIFFDIGFTPGIDAAAAADMHRQCIERIINVVWRAVGVVFALLANLGIASSCDPDIVFAVFLLHPRAARPCTPILREHCISA